MKNKKGQEFELIFFLFLSTGIIILFLVFKSSPYEDKINFCKELNKDKFKMNSLCSEGSLINSNYKEYSCTIINYDKLNEYCFNITSIEK